MTAEPIRSGDVDAVAQSLDELASSPELSQRMGEAARAQARARFSADVVVPHYEQVYERLVGRRER